MSILMMKNGSNLSECEAEIKWAGKEIQLFPPVLFMKPYQSDSECARTGVRPDAHSERELK